ncbi:TrmH family RNA methyltransferase [Flagellimonas aequoris]|uniref:RNA methyltransferase n=1 Tax=Flagellimonas aequoris TaxID=2306997 RepID=A0A418N2A9_9FLAO|nr:RNA methyltransferase [Allomuricauda aequoris]RIV67432.1 RNA methyltransferase [Allomuricauda aequoris]TXJ99253.1 RNA methyltransferase [Allomuricauda aequoris]
MVTKNQIKLVVSLKQKKYRSQHGLFVVEGEKLVKELLREGLRPFKIFVASGYDSSGFGEVDQISTADLKQMSSLKQPNGVLGVFYMPEVNRNQTYDWIVALDAVRDPGNLGTIIRLCDWFGIKQLVCSEDTVDCYNPKVLQATMGSIARVNIIYTDLTTYIKKLELPVFGTFMDGTSIYAQKMPDKGILVMGNEANGISKEITDLVTERISIPQFGEPTAESLNVATATAILLNEIRR